MKDAPDQIRSGYNTGDNVPYLKSRVNVCFHNEISHTSSHVELGEKEQKEPLYYLQPQMTLGRFGLKKSIYHRNAMMETKVADFVSTVSKTIKCDHCSKLFVNQQGLSVHEKCVHGVSGKTKAAGKRIQPKKDPVGETDIKIAVPRCVG